MKLIHFCFLFFLFLNHRAISQDFFQKYIYTTTGEADICDVVKTPQGWITVGTIKTTKGDTDIYYRKSNECFLPLVEKKIGGNNDDVAQAICVSHDNQIVIAGNTKDLSGKSKAYLIKINDKGGLAWRKTFEEDKDLEVVDVKKSFDDHIFLLANYNKKQEIYLMKIDKHGHLIWARSYGKKYRDFANTLYVGEANNCYVAGSTRSFSHKIQDVLLMKVDSTGHLQWARAYGGPHDDICYDMVRTKDLGFALVGGARSFHTVNEKPFVLKLNAVGGYEWFKPVSTTQKGKALAIGETPNRALIVAMHMGEKAFVSRLSSHGNISWTQTQKEEGLTIKRINTLPNESILLLGNKNNKMELNKLAGYSAKNCSLEDGKIKFSIARPIAFTPILHTKPKAPIISYIGKVSDVKLLQRNGCSEMGTTIQKEFNPLGENRTLCDNKMILDAGKGFSYYQWHNGSRSQLFVATAPGEYWVTVSDGCNLYTDTIQLLKCENNKVEEPKEVAPEKLKVKPKILSELQVGDKIVVKNLLFHQGTDTPIDPAYVAINDIYLYMKDRPNSVIELLGHTDNQGRHYLNLKLSKKRVEKVKDILEARGISPERVIISFYGGKYPIASNIDENTRRLNRRVELKIISL